MLRVIVSVKQTSEERGRDLEVPAEVGAGQLAVMIGRALEADGSESGGSLGYQIEVSSLGRVLAPDESLRDAGVWNGSELVLHPRESDHVPVEPSQTIGAQDEDTLDEMARKAETLARLGRSRQAVQTYQQIIGLTSDRAKRSRWEAAMEKIAASTRSVSLSEPCLATLTTQSSQVFRVTQMRVRVGRNSEKDNVVNDIDLQLMEGASRISRRQFRLEQKGGQWYLQTEAGTRNPTFVHGEEVARGERVRLHDGDEIRIGTARLLFNTRTEHQSLAQEKADES